MRKSHIDYLRIMVESVILDGVAIFAPDPIAKKQSRFLEILPPADSFQRLIPLCVLYKAEINDKLDARQNTEKRLKELQSIAPIVDGEGIKIFRTLRIEFKQEFNYTLHFVVKDPTRDINSDVDSPGILDQCKRYISNNPKTYSKVIRSTDAITTEDLTYAVNIDVTASGLITQYAADGIYVLSLDIVFRDKLITLLEDPAIKGTIQIEQPIGVTQL